MKNKGLLFILILINSCRVVDFTISNNEFIDTNNLVYNSAFFKIKNEVNNYEKITRNQAFIFFKDGSYLKRITFRSIYEYDTDQLKLPNSFYGRNYSVAWGIFTQINDTTILTESINNVSYLTGLPIISFLPIFDTFYVEKFIFRNDTTLHRYLKKDKTWELQDTLYLNTTVDVSFIDPSKAWIYDNMLPYPYWKNKKKLEIKN